jgi:hypothetical protein
MHLFQLRVANSCSYDHDPVLDYSLSTGKAHAAPTHPPACVVPLSACRPHPGTGRGACVPYRHPAAAGGQGAPEGAPALQGRGLGLLAGVAAFASGARDMSGP